MSRTQGRKYLQSAWQKISRIPMATPKQAPAKRKRISFCRETGIWANSGFIWVPFLQEDNAFLFEKSQNCIYDIISGCGRFHLRFQDVIQNGLSGVDGFYKLLRMLTAE